jgi:hypothetical protein
MPPQFVWPPQVAWQVKPQVWTPPQCVRGPQVIWQVCPQVWMPPQTVWPPQVAMGTQVWGTWTEAQRTQTDAAVIGPPGPGGQPPQV